MDFLNIPVTCEDTGKYLEFLTRSWSRVVLNSFWIAVFLCVSNMMNWHINTTYLVFLSQVISYHITGYDYKRLKIQFGSRANNNMNKAKSCIELQVIGYDAIEDSIYCETWWNSIEEAQNRVQNYWPHSLITVASMLGVRRMPGSLRKKNAVGVINLDACDEVKRKSIHCDTISCYPDVLCPQKGR